MTRSWWIAGAGAVVLALGLGLRSYAPVAPSASEQPNLLILVWDTVRADHLVPYGYDRATTPWLAGFAEESVLFERAIAPEMWTPPTHASMFTGFAPQHHGVKATYKWLDAHHTTLAEHLGAQGYATFAFSANPYVSQETNLMQGFETFASSFTKPHKRTARKLQQAKLIERDRSTDISPGWEGKRMIGDVHPFKDAGPVAHEALASWVTETSASGRPWFAFVNFMEAHIPRVPSMESRKALLDEATLENGFTTVVSQMDLLAYTFGKKEYTPDELAAVAGVYDAALHDLDAATGAMIDDLRARGLLDNTIVILTADHGENLGDHHMFGHKFALWDTLTHVPLVIWWPEHLQPRRVPTTVSVLALFSTVLDLLKIEAPTPGPDLVGSVLDSARPTPVFSALVESTPVSITRVDSQFGLEDSKHWLRTLRSVEEDGYKLIAASDGELDLFHLPSDPGELNDLSQAEPARAEGLHTQIRTHEASTPLYDASLRVKGDRPADRSRSENAMLAALGYVDGEEAPSDEAVTPAPDDGD